MIIKRVSKITESSNAAEEVSNYIIFKLNKVDAKKLQKLLYYCCAFFYTLENKHFMNSKIDFEAWVHGPVNVATYARFADKSKKMENITFQSSDMAFDNLNKQEREFIDEVLILLGNLKGYQLEAMTHQETPWKEKREGLGELEASQRTISYNTIKKYYSDKVSKN